MRPKSASSPSWRIAMGTALRRHLWRRGQEAAPVDLGAAVALALRNSTDRRLREAAPDAAVSKMVRLLSETDAAERVE